MAYCKNCGQETSNTDSQCPKCGTPTKNAATVVDNGGFLWGLLGFCIPLVGLILWAVWKSEKPLTAKALITGAAIGFVLNIIVAILQFGVLAATM